MSNVHTALVESVSDALYAFSNRSRVYADKDAAIAVEVFVETLVGLADDDLTVADLVQILGFATDTYTHEGALPSDPAPAGEAAAVEPEPAA